MARRSGNPLQELLEVFYGRQSTAPAYVRLGGPAADGGFLWRALAQHSPVAVVFARPAVSNPEATVVLVAER